MKIKYNLYVWCKMKVIFKASDQITILPSSIIKTRLIKFHSSEAVWNITQNIRGNVEEFWKEKRRDKSLNCVTFLQKYSYNYLANYRPNGLNEYLLKSH